MSDFAAARFHLERAFDKLNGQDEISVNAREALDLLIEAVATVENKRHCGKVFPFPKAGGKRSVR